MTWLDSVLLALFNAIITGAGVALGTWLSQRALIKHFEKMLDKKLLKKNKGGLNGK